MEALIQRVWENPTFHEQHRAVTSAWLRRELDIEGESSLEDGVLVQCLQAATILSSSEDQAQRRAAYSIAACAADLGRESLPGVDGALRIVLTRMGNFPAIRTVSVVGTFGRLPTQVALSEELRREGNRVQLGDQFLELTDFQRALWEVLIKGENVAISAPTSAGKSFVLQTYLRARARSGAPGAACYLVPSRALIAQVSDAIFAWRRDDGLDKLSVVTIPLPSEADLPDRAIYVLTQERLQAILSAHPDFVADLIICDEAHSIEDGARGALLQNVIDQLLARNPDAQTAFAGPNIRNLNAFGSIFNLKLVREVQNRSPSVIQNLILVNTRSLASGVLGVERLSDGTTTELGNTDISRPLPSIRERLVRVSERFGKAKPSILYANGPADAEGIALGLTDVLEGREPSDRIRDLIKLAQTAVHQKFALSTCLQHGVGFHYGRIPALVRRGIEAAFADGELNYLVTTSTLIQGVNFPAANLFVCKPKKGQSDPLDVSEFWNLAGRAGRLGKEFQGNIFLIDYQDWAIKYAEQPNEIEVRSSIEQTVSTRLNDVIACAGEVDPPLENEKRLTLEATFARLLSDHMSGKLSATLERYDLSADERNSIMAAVASARAHVTLPIEVISASPTVSALRQQRLANYLLAEIQGGGLRRLEQITPRHPRDDEAWVRLSEVFKICHRQLLSLNAPKLHLRMAAIAVKWMRGDPVPEIVDENHRRSGGSDISRSIRETLKDIEQEIRFKYLRLTTCYMSVLGHMMRETGHAEAAERLPNVPNFLEVGAADQTMISLISLGLSRVTAGAVAERSMDKNMDRASALSWLGNQNLETMLSSQIMRDEVGARARRQQLGPFLIRRYAWVKGKAFPGTVASCDPKTLGLIFCLLDFEVIYSRSHLSRRVRVSL